MKRIALFVCLSALAAFGQGGAVTAVPTITNTRGEPVPYAKVAVCSANPGSAPATVCLGLFATLSTDITLGTPCATNVTPIGSISGTGCTNPGKSDGLGNVVAFAPAGQYWCEYFGGSISQPLVIPCFFASGGGSASVGCPTALNGSIAAFTSPIALGCDKNAGTNFSGDLFGQSWSSIANVLGFVSLVGGLPSPGTTPKYKLPANTFRWLAPATVGTPYYFVPPPTRGTPGQVVGKLSETTDGNGDPVVITQWQNSVAASTEVQVNGVDTTAQTPINFINGTNTIVSNPSVGQIRIDASGAAAPTMGTPVAPTLAVGGTPGAATVTYLVQGCQDGPTCAYHTLTSSTSTTSTANATLSSSPITLTVYGDTLYGPRCYNIYRTVGGPSQGKIGTCVGKSFIDTGVAGDGTTATNTNTTILDANGLTAPLPGCNKIPAAPWGIDGPPCSPNAMDDEFAWGNGTWAPGDANNPFWTRFNAGSSTYTLTNGELVIAATGAAGDNYRGMTQALPSAPWTFVTTTLLHYATGSANEAGGVCLYDGTKLTAFVMKSSGTIEVSDWTNVTTFSALPFTTANATFNAVWAYWKIQNDNTSIIFSYSFDGVDYLQVLSRAKASFQTPTKIGPCVNANTNSPQMSVDYFRRTQ